MNLNIFVRFIERRGLTQIFSFTDDLFKKTDRFQTSFPFETIEVDFDLASRADRDFVFAGFHQFTEFRI